MAHHQSLSHRLHKFLVFLATAAFSSASFCSDLSHISCISKAGSLAFVFCWSATVLKGGIVESSGGEKYTFCVVSMHISYTDIWIIHCCGHYVHLWPAKFPENVCSIYIMDCVNLPWGVLSSGKFDRITLICKWCVLALLSQIFFHSSDIAYSYGIFVFYLIGDLKVAIQDGVQVRFQIIFFATFIQPEGGEKAFVQHTVLAVWFNRYSTSTLSWDKATFWEM